MGVAKAALEAAVRFASMDLGADNITANAMWASLQKTLAAGGIRDSRLIGEFSAGMSPQG